MQIDKLRTFGKGPTPKRVRLAPEGPVYESEDEEEANVMRADNRVFQKIPALESEDESNDGLGDADAGEVEVREAPTHGTYVLSVVGRRRSTE